MTDYKKMIIQRKLFHLQSLCEHQIPCIVSAFDSIKNVNIDSEIFTACVTNALELLESGPELDEEKSIYKLQAVQILNRILEFVNTSEVSANNNQEGIVYPNWPPLS